MPTSSGEPNIATSTTPAMTNASTTSYTVPSTTSYTRNLSGPGLVQSQKIEYETLVNEIKNTISRNDDLFKQINQSNYPNAAAYQSDLLNYKIDEQVKDITTTRQQIWDYLTRKYAENTKLKKYYFDEMRKADEHLNDINIELEKIKQNVETNKLKGSTANEKIKQEKYIIDKNNYYSHLYKVLIGLQIIIIIFIIIGITGLIPTVTSLIITVILLLGGLAYVGYYVFFKNLARNKFSWNKVEHDNLSISRGSPLSNANANSAQVNKQKQQADTDIQSIVNRSKSPSDSNCSVVSP